LIYFPLSLLIVYYRYRNLSDDESIVLSYVEGAAREGIWVKIIRTRSGLPNGNVSQAIKKLETKGYIKPFHSAKHPRQKVYILSTLQPSEDVTGGLFFDAGQVDHPLMEQLMKLAEVYIHRKSWHPKESTFVDKNGKRKRPKEQREDQIDNSILDGAKRWKGVRPLPPGFPGYPTVADISRYINGLGVLKEKIMEAETEQILDLLCWDGRIEKVQQEGYRSILHPMIKYHSGEAEEPVSAFSEAPCGGCPVFELCDESGPVNAQTCAYFEDWL
jgi:DNA-directed RNA polymerase III subunit RPC6